MKYLVSNPRSSSAAVSEMRLKLDSFYATTTDYSAFEETPDQTVWFALVLPYMRDLIRNRSRIRVLEIGAGRSGFTHVLGEDRGCVEYHVQDVTATNSEYLQNVADRVWIGDLSDVNQTFDLIFHTFVFEHVATPSEFLEKVDSLLSPGGIHIVICPRYDVPGYICPSVRHLSGSQRMLHTLQLTASRMLARMDRRPRFLVNIEPAVFHVPWYRDSDAVHLVSRFDIERWHSSMGYKVERLRSRVGSLREWVFYRQLICMVACQKNA